MHDYSSTTARLMLMLQIHFCNAVKCLYPLERWYLGAAGAFLVLQGHQGQGGLVDYPTMTHHVNEKITPVPSQNDEGLGSRSASSITSSTIDELMSTLGKRRQTPYPTSAELRRPWLVTSSTPKISFICEDHGQATYPPGEEESWIR